MLAIKHSRYPAEVAAEFSLMLEKKQADICTPFDKLQVYKTAMRKAAYSIQNLIKDRYALTREEQVATTLKCLRASEKGNHLAVLEAVNYYPLLGDWVQVQVHLRHRHRHRRSWKARLNTERIWVYNRSKYCA